MHPLFGPSQLILLWGTYEQLESPIFQAGYSQC